MISPRALDDAVARGIITPTQSDALRAIEAGFSSVGEPAPRDAERLRFVSGFADIFVTIGIMLFLGAIHMLAGGTLPGDIALLALSWLLAELFTRRRRMALPSLALTAAFGLSALFLAGDLLISDARYRPALRLLSDPDGMLPYAALAAAAALALHYWRFRVPATPAAITAALLLAVLAPLDIPFEHPGFEVALFAGGFATFAAAMWFDARDPARQTSTSEIAFWLHLLAAPLVVHPVMNRVGGEVDDPVSAGLVLLVFLGLGVIALLINRRAILVSGLFYAGVALAALAQDSGLEGVVFPVAILLLGAFILLLSIGWDPLRKAAISRLPAPVSRFLPPLTVSAT